MCRQRSAASPPLPDKVLLGWLGAAVADQLGCQRLWIMFLAYAAVCLAAVLLGCQGPVLMCLYFFMFLCLLALV